MSKTRLTMVYTVSENHTLEEAWKELEKTRQDLPEGADLQVCLRSAQGMDTQIRWVPFGDLVQLIDFEHGWQAQRFDDSEAYENQMKRTSGFFSNIAMLSCTMIPDGENGEIHAPYKPCQLKK